MKKIFLSLAMIVGAVFFFRSPAYAYPDCSDTAFRAQCYSFKGTVQSGPCSDSGRKFITVGGSAVTSLSSSSEMPDICSTGGAGAGGYCCGLMPGEVCSNISGADCRPDATCAQVNKCTIEGTDYITYADRVCTDGYTCCAKVNDVIAGCVATPSSSGASGGAKAYDETACTAVSGVCGTSCGASQLASGTVNCGEKDGAAYACCLDKNTCTSGGGYCASSCLSGDSPDATKTDCSSGICCKAGAGASSGLGGATGGASGAAAGGTGVGTGSLIQANSYTYNPPVRGNVNQIVASIIKKITPYLGGVMLLMFFYGGVLWMTAAGDAAQVKKAKSVLSTSVIGILIVVAAFTLASALVKVLGNALAP